MKIPFHNTETAFQYKSTWELTQAYLLFKAVGSPALVHWGSRFLNTFIHTPIPFGFLEIGKHTSELQSL